MYNAQNDYSWNAQAKYEAIGVIRNTMLNLMKQKVVSRKSNVDYISPQEIYEHLPSSLRIDRVNHINKHHGGQWEIRNKNICCYLGFQVVWTKDLYTKSLLKEIISLKSEQYRYHNYIGDNDQDYYECDVCYDSATIFPGFNRHICRVNGYFECDNYHCNGRTFKVGICLLDPMTLTPPTRYQCANCGYDATFIRYDLKGSKQSDIIKPHRKDLCDACHIWGDCRMMFIQPSIVCNGLTQFCGAKTRWEMNTKRNGAICSFEIYDRKSKYYGDHQFEIRPFVNCVYVNDYKYFSSQQNQIRYGLSNNNKYYNTNGRYNKPKRNRKPRNSPNGNRTNQTRKNQQTKGRNNNKPKRSKNQKRNNNKNHNTKAPNNKPKRNKKQTNSAKNKSTKNSSKRRNKSNQSSKNDMRNNNKNHKGAINEPVSPYDMFFLLHLDM